MALDISTLLDEAAPVPRHAVDVVAVRARARQLDSRRRRALLTGALAVMIVVVVVSFAFFGRSSTTQRVHIAGTTPIPAPPTTVTFDGDGDTVQLADGWSRADGLLVPYLLDPHELGSFATIPLAADDQGPGCDAQLPKGALDALQPTDAFVWIAEANPAFQSTYPQDVVGSTTFPTRPEHFSSNQFAPFDCAGPTWSYPHATFGDYWFTDNGRTLGAYVVLGDQASAERAAQVFALLDSLQFVPRPA